MLRVLVADDDASVRKLLEVMLEDYEVIFASDGREALDLIELSEVDVAVLDVLMPLIDGFEVLRRLRKAPRTADMPVIMLTALASEDDHGRAFQGGADAYVTKPFEPAALMATIERIRRASPDERRRNRADEAETAKLLRQLDRRFR